MPHQFPTNGNSPQRHLGLLGATSLGVGAIVGGGILALAGVAFATSGPSAILAFAANGVIALLTALSFAEMASKFPESGGIYAFAKKVLSVEAAFMVGWVAWFASMVAAALYALGFAYFTWDLLDVLWPNIRYFCLQWCSEAQSVVALAIGAALFLTIRLIRQPAGGGGWANAGKVACFSVLVAGGIWAVCCRPPGEIAASLRPFFPAGAVGLVQAMGYTFIAMQGFDLIAAAGGEIREPARNIPRAMIGSLSTALAIYLPLLFVMATVGIPAGMSVQTVAAEAPEELVAITAQQTIGPFGYWLVIGAAILSMFSALQANLFAASRIAFAMAGDRTLPTLFNRLHPSSQTPWAAVLLTTSLIVLLLALLHDVASAGAAASLIFLCTFSLAHWISILIRQRSADRPPPFRSPWFPAIPIVGGLACISLAIFQGFAVPSAGLITSTWLGIGGILFIALFARRARIMDATNTAMDPELVALKGRTPLVLVPLTNPKNADAMVTLAGALAPSDVARVMLLTIIQAADDWNPEQDPRRMEQARHVLEALLKSSARSEVRAETMLTVAQEPMAEIARVAKLHRCQSVLLGLSEDALAEVHSPLERLLGTANADIVILRAPEGWQIADAHKILVPIGGRGGHDLLVARLLGSLVRTRPRQVTLLGVLPPSASSGKCRRRQRDLARMGDDLVGPSATAMILQSDHPASVLVEQADLADLVILGVERVNRNHRLFGTITRQVASQSTCPLLVVSRR
jgi:basic amino acid/polyamine antiporter, APA family